MDKKLRRGARTVKAHATKGQQPDPRVDFARALHPEIDSALAIFNTIDGSDALALQAALQALADAAGNDLQLRAFVRIAAVKKLWAVLPRPEALRAVNLVFPESDSTAASPSAAAVQRAQKDRILDRALEFMTLFHDSGGRSYASVERSGHVETWPVRSRECRLFLRKLYYESAGGNQAPSAQAIIDAIETLDARAHFDGERHDVFVRVATTPTAIYLDLADDDWRCVEVTAAGWRICDEPPVKFRRARGMLPLPLPGRGGSISELAPLVNASDDNWTLLVTWMVAALRGTGPFPVLAVHGQQGSAKSTLCRVARMLIDPNQAPIRAAPREPRDLMIAANNGWLVAFDNLSVVPAWLSDALCRLSTGGGFSVRSLYTDDDEMIFDAQRPVVINGIEELADRGDLLDRCVILTLPVIAEDRRRAEKDFWPAFDMAHPRILGALLDATSSALRTADSVTLPKLPRMADFAVWATAAAPALELTSAQFLNAYTQNRRNAVAIELEAAVITEPLLAVLGGAEWEGTFGALLELLNKHTDDKTRRREKWPDTPRGLSGALRRLAPALKSAGIEIIFPETSNSASPRHADTSKRGHGGVRKLRIVPSPPPPNGRKPNESGNFSGDDPGDDLEDRSTSSPTEPLENAEDGDGGDGGDGLDPSLSTTAEFFDDARELDEDA